MEAELHADDLAISSFYRGLNRNRRCGEWNGGNELKRELRPDVKSRAAPESDPGVTHVKRLGEGEALAEKVRHLERCCRSRRSSSFVNASGGLLLAERRP